MKHHIIACLLLCTAVASDCSDTLIVANGLHDIDMTGFFILDPRRNAKGPNLLCSPIPPGECLTLGVPSIVKSVLAFDELTNSYLIDLQAGVRRPDTMVIGLEHLTYGDPHVDHGGCSLKIVNFLEGIALDSVYLSSTDSIFHRIDGHRLFPGHRLIVWLNGGTWSIRAVDQIGRVLAEDSIQVPAEEPLYIDSDMLVETPEPVGIAGEGSSGIYLINCLPFTSLKQVSIRRYSETTIFLDSLSLKPGTGLVAALDRGECVVSATDWTGVSYSIDMKIETGEFYLLWLTFDFLQPEFSFPVNRR